MEKYLHPIHPPILPCLLFPYPPSSYPHLPISPMLSCHSFWPYTLVRWTRWDQFLRGESVTRRRWTRKEGYYYISSDVT